MQRKFKLDMTFFVISIHAIISTCKGTAHQVPTSYKKLPATVLAGCSSREGCVATFNPTLVKFALFQRTKTVRAILIYLYLTNFFILLQNVQRSTNDKKIQIRCVY